MSDEKGILSGAGNKPMYYLFSKETGHIEESNDSAKFGKWLSDIENRTIKKTSLHRMNISTVCLGLDHNFVGRGDPVIFETMIFPDEGVTVPGFADDDEFQERHCTGCA